MSDDPIMAVRNLLIEGLGVPAGKVTPHARVFHDLGIDGDDAVELFEALHIQFDTDFTELYRQWRVFFGTEGFSLQGMLFSLPAIIVCAGAASVLAAALHWPQFIAVVLALALLVGSGWLLSEWFGQDLHPVTVAGIAEIVRIGRWPTDPADVR